VAGEKKNGVTLKCKSNIASDQPFKKVKLARSPRKSPAKEKDECPREGQRSVIKFNIEKKIVLMAKTKE